MDPLPSLFDLSLDQLREALTAQGVAGFRAQQIWKWMYPRLALSLDEMTDLPAPLRQRLAEQFSLSPVAIRLSATSQDRRTEKLLLALRDSQSIETVVMYYDRRHTACVSTQVGCGMGCSFCATGQMGLRRNLTAGEIVAQVLLVARRLVGQGQRLSNVVLMGMGEPFHNYDASLGAVDRLNDPDGFNFGARRFTISTVGIVPMIERFTAERRQVNLAVSLHAATDSLRDALIPINRRYPLAELIPACRAYVGHSGRRITFEWALIEGVNDLPEQADALCGLLKGLNCHVNLIPLNPTRGYEGVGSPPDRARAFAERLEQAGIACTVRVRRGIDIHAGCGQLATQAEGEPGKSPASTSAVDVEAGIGQAGESAPD